MELWVTTSDVNLGKLVPLKVCGRLENAKIATKKKLMLEWRVPYIVGKLKRRPFLPHPKHASLSLGGLQAFHVFDFLPFGALLGLSSNFSCTCLSFLHFLRYCHELLSLPTLAGLTSPTGSFLSTASSLNLSTIRIRSCKLSGN